MLYVFIGVVVFAIASLLIRAHEKVEKMKDDASKIPEGKENTIRKRIYGDIDDEFKKK